MINAKHQMRTVSVRDIAAKVGCSHVTVSRALRGQKKVSDGLRAQILAVADQLGYKRNPLICSLMAAQKNKENRKGLSANMCWLNTHLNETFWHRHTYTKNIRGAAEARARELGYGFEEIWANEPGMTGKRIAQIAHARGVQGFIVAGRFDNYIRTGFDPKYFSFVCLGEHQHAQLAWHRACISERKNAALAFSKLREYGYKRIGLVAGVSDPSSHVNESIKRFNSGLCRDPGIAASENLRSRLSGFYYMQSYVDPEARVPPNLYERITDSFFLKISDYIEQHRVDAIISNDRAVSDAIEACGLRLPEDLAIAHTSLGTDVESWAGIDSFPERQTHAAVELLASQIEQNQKGVPPFAQNLFVEGQWIDGWTAPDKRRTEEEAHAVEVFKSEPDIKKRV